MSKPTNYDAERFASSPRRQESGNRWTDLGSALDEYLRLQEGHQSDQMKLVGPLVDDWIRSRDEIAKNNRFNGASFNPLRSININETTHSRILGDLLNPSGTHGQKALFLRPFLEMLGISNADAGLWNVTVETGRVDILIWRNLPEKCAIIIENKSNGAGDQLNQIYRYWHREIYLWDPGLWRSKDERKISERNRRFHVVYLTADEGKKPEQHSMKRPDGMAAENPCEHVPLDPVVLHLENLMALWTKNAIPQLPLENERLRAFLSQYQELWIK